MSVEHILKRIQDERATLKKDVYDAQGLLRLQETMEAYDGEYRLIWSDELFKELENRPETVLHETGVGLLDKAIGAYYYWGRYRTRENNDGTFPGRAVFET
jgi:hypothetical protein